MPRGLSFRAALLPSLLLHALVLGALLFVVHGRRAAPRAGEPAKTIGVVPR